MTTRAARKLAANPSRALRFASLAVLGLFVSLVGCGPDALSEDESGSAGAAAAGRAGQDGNSGEGGERSDGGPGGEGGDGGSDHSLAIVGCDGETPFEANAQIVRSCLLRAGCNPTFAPVRTISTCVTFNTQASLAGEACNLTSASCADFEACEHVGVAHEDLCGTQTSGTRCEGDLAINCGNNADSDSFYDCAALGGTCGTLTSQDVLYADCQLDIGTDSCAGLPSTDATHYCHSGGGKADDLRYYCWEGQAFGASCSEFASCIDTAGEGGAGGAPELGNANCFFHTDSCQGGDAVSCNADVATVCSGGSQFEYNCGSVGLSCSITGQKEHCLAPGCNAADVDFVCQERCSDDGSSLTFCYGGAPLTVDCADYGFTHCASGMDADSGRTFAACRF